MQALLSPRSRVGPTWRGWAVDRAAGAVSGTGTSRPGWWENRLGWWLHQHNSVQFMLSGRDMLKMHGDFV